VKSVLNDPRVDPSLKMTQFFFGGTFFYWLSVLMLCPLLTMRTFSEEKRMGTMEVLLSAPVTDTQVVLAKFLGAWLCDAVGRKVTMIAASVLLAVSAVVTAVPAKT